jgi:hypothetical protein
MVDSAPQPAFTAQTWPVEPMVATDTARGQAALHAARQRERGWHPHDYGEPIRPAVVWTTATPVQADRRTVHVDVGACPATDDGVQSAVIALSRNGSEWVGYEARPVDDSRLRWCAPTPEDPAIDGWLPDGRYTVKVLLVDAAGDEHEWSPMTAGDRDTPPEPATVRLITSRPLKARAA